MGMPLRWLPQLPETLVSGLEAQGIHDTEALLSNARLPPQRKRLSSTVSADEATLETWAAVADLLRISSLTPASAVLIVTSGLARSVQELSDVLGVPHEGPSGAGIVLRDPTVRPEIADALRFLEAYAMEHGSLGKVPWESDLERAAGEAGQLVPRLVPGRDAAPGEAEEGLEELRRASLRHAVRTSAGLVLWVVGLVLVGVMTLRFLLRRQFASGLDEIIDQQTSPAQSELLESARVVTLQALDISMAALAGLLGVVVVILALLLVLHELVSRSWHWIAWRTVLRDVDARRAYVSVMRMEVNRAAHMGHVAWILVGGVTLIGLVSLFGERSFAWTGLSGDQALIIGSALLVPLGVVAIYVPLVRQLARRTRADGSESPRVVRALSANTTLRLLIEVAFLLGVIQLLPVLVASASAPIAEMATARIERTVESATADFDRLLDRVDTPGFDGDGDELARQFTRQLAPLGGLLESSITEIPSALNQFARYLTPSLLLAALFAVVLPFLILGGWLRGAFFMVLLAAISWTEVGTQRYVTASVGRWFSSSEVSWLVPALVSFAVFSNAIVFEWIYELVLERRKGCAGCRADVEAGAAFCPRCGMPQTSNFPR
ncbi:MAG: DUF4332 domain-containing protein [Thioalkalivibrio sp.]|nr:DUF4332 domain-containing protein [Thioalkalivibrio sp.]